MIRLPGPFLFNQLHPPPIHNNVSAFIKPQRDQRGPS